MWECHSESVSGPDVIRITFSNHRRRMTFRQAIIDWEEDEALREAFIQALTNAPFTGFRWECPPLTQATVDREFECVLLRADGLDRRPDAAAFAEFFAAAGESSVVGFPSLGRDAYLVAPCPRAQPSIYPHLASFVRGAPRQQVHELWKCVGREVSDRLSDQPLWLSTAGMGVAWLHVRLDSRPKYYGHRPYIARP